MTDDAPCLWCDQPSFVLCDAVLGFTFKDGIKTLGPHFTCDAPMCPDHATTVGHLCGKEPNTIDRCPYHIEHADHNDYADGEDESAVKRRAVYAAVRRSQLRTCDEKEQCQ